MFQIFITKRGKAVRPPPGVNTDSYREISLTIVATTIAAVFIASVYHIGK